MLWIDSRAVSSGVHKCSAEFFLCNPYAHWHTAMRREVFLVSFVKLVPAMPERGLSLTFETTDDGIGCGHRSDSLA